VVEANSSSDDGSTQGAVNLSTSSDADVTPRKKTLLTRIITMDVGRESDYDDAVDGELNPINQENGVDKVQYGYRCSRR
jgi:hypothetical protein